MFGSIAWRTAAVFVLLILIFTGGLSAYLAYFFNESYMENQRAQLVNEARIIEGFSETLFVEGQTAGIDALAKRLGEQAEGRITIIAVDGVVLGDSLEDPAMMDNHADRPEVIEALAVGEGSSTRYSETLGYDMLYVAVPVTDGADIVGAVRVSVPLTRIHGYIGYINRTVISVSLAAAAVAVLVAFQLSRISTDSIKKLTVMSGRLAEGKLDEEIQVNSRDEVGRLAHAFNQMASRLKDTVSLITTERDRMAAILSHMGDGIILVDGESRIMLANRAAESMLGLPQGYCAGRIFIEAVRDYEIDSVVKECISSGRQQTSLVETERDKRFFGVSATPLLSEEGCVVRVQDLTELRRLETVRRDFVANVSHELRTPITSLKALAETLREGAVEDPEVARDFVGKVEIEVDRLAQMVQELGELSRIESGEVPIAKEPVDIASVVERTVERLRAQASRAGLTLEMRMTDDLPEVLGDEARLEQVLVNLIHNSIKFTPVGGRIEVAAGPIDNQLQVSVKDTGVGISPDDLPRVFERFYKADRSRSSSGTGLGLAIAKHVVEAHGGRIRAESTPGHGATFIFTLPSSRG